MLCALKISPLCGFDFYVKNYIPRYTANGRLLLKVACILMVAAALLAGLLYILINNITKIDHHVPTPARELQ
jgi:hypothetical protein